MSAQACHDLFQAICVVLALACLGPPVNLAQAADRILLVELHREREEGVAVSGVVVLGMEADRHPQPHGARVPMVVQKPAPQPAGGHRKDGVVDCGAVDLLRGVMERLKRDGGEGDAAAGPDLPVEG